MSSYEATDCALDICREKKNFFSGEGPSVTPHGPKTPSELWVLKKHYLVKQGTLCNDVPEIHTLRNLFLRFSDLHGIVFDMFLPRQPQN